MWNILHASVWSHFKSEAISTESTRTMFDKEHGWNLIVYMYRFTDNDDKERDCVTSFYKILSDVEKEKPDVTIWTITIRRWEARTWTTFQVIYSSSTGSIYQVKTSGTRLTRHSGPGMRIAGGITRTYIENIVRHCLLVLNHFIWIPGCLDWSFQAPKPSRFSPSF